MSAANTNGTRNKSAGHAWEREIAKILKNIGYPHVVTTRSESVSRDAQKVDLMNKDEGTNGRLPYNIQAKTLAKGVVYYKVLSEMPVGKIPNVIFHRQTKKSSVGKRFMVTGTYAILTVDDFVKIIGDLKKYQEGYELLNTYFDSISDEEQKIVDAELKKIGL